MKTLKLKQIFSDVFSLKNKTLTILLGTFVPFFVCHILAYLLASLKNFNSKSIYSKKVYSGTYFFFLFLYSLIFFAVYAIVIFGFIKFPFWLSSISFLPIILVLNLILSLILMDKRKEKGLI